MAKKYLFILGIAGTVAGATVLVKDYFRETAYQGTERIPGKTVIITGASSGIGRETALELAKRGGRILMACRDIEKCERVRQELIDASYNKNIHCRKLDLLSMKSVREFAENVNQNEKRVDILVNNAAAMYCKRKVTEDGFEIHLGGNYLGHFLLTNLLLDKLQKCAPSRIINVSSIGYGNTELDYRNFNYEYQYDYQRAYKRSKLALTMFSYDLSKRLAGSGVSVYTVLPGLCQTDLRRELSMNRSRLSRAVLGPFWAFVFSSAKDGAQTSIYCALSADLAKETGKLYTSMKEIEFHEIIKKDDRHLKRLWATSESWTQLNQSPTPSSEQTLQAKSTS